MKSIALLIYMLLAASEGRGQEKFAEMVIQNHDTNYRITFSKEEIIQLRVRIAEYNECHDGRDTLLSEIETRKQLNAQQEKDIADLTRDYNDCFIGRNKDAQLLNEFSKANSILILDKQGLIDNNAKLDLKLRRTRTAAIVFGGGFVLSAILLLAK